MRRNGNQVARRMKKLIDQAERLLQKNRNKKDDKKLFERINKHPKKSS